MSIEKFFVNLVGVSTKRHMELKFVKKCEITDGLASEKLETSRGINQIRTLQQAGATRWSSHFVSIRRLIDMFSVARTIPENMS